MPTQQKTLPPHPQPTTHKTRPRELKNRFFRDVMFWKASQKVQKYFYPYVTHRLGADDVVFFNYGYEQDPPMALPLGASDEPDRYCSQLYHSTATQVDLSGKRVLEVSCGHGGGASYLMRTLHPTSYTGLDLNPAAIAFCRKKHNLDGLDFVRGDAENLPFADQSFDAVINIEASLHYLRFPRFLAEVARVLRPGGHFLYADFRSADGIAAWEAALAGSPLRMLSQRMINAEVVRGMDKNSHQWRERIDRHVPAFLRGVARDFAGVSTLTFYEEMRTGGLSYRMHCFAAA
jgi:fatty-acid O-methyltransferase